MNSLIQRYRASQRRLILLDYDGVLAEITPKPEDSVPTAGTLQALRQLAANTKNTVVVISGRRRSRLEEWLGDLPISLTAEHGNFIRQQGNGWTPVGRSSHDWKAQLLPILETANIPGSRLYEKETTLVWHYHLAEPTEAEQHRLLLIEQLSPIIDALDVEILEGHKILEVRPTGIHKGTAALYWLALDDYDFVMMIGDDVTDEDMFAAAPPEAITIKVGPGETRAQERLADPAAVRSLLMRLAVERDIED